jgi:hypothetical protein
LRTATIDEIHVVISNGIKENPAQVLNEIESLLDFFVSLLNDPNFKIVLMTLSIINLLISMPQHMEYNLNQNEKPGMYLTGQCLGKHVPRLIGKLADSKNIIRQ